MSRIDSLTEARRGIGICCPCGKPARITVRGQNLCYGCFDRNVDAALILPVTSTLIQDC